MAKQLGCTEEQLEKVVNYEEAEDFTPKQKAALRFVDAFYQDHRGFGDKGHVSESIWEGMREHFSDAEIVEIAWYVAITMAYGKLIYAFQVPREYEI